MVLFVLTPDKEYQNHRRACVHHPVPSILLGKGCYGKMAAELSIPERETCRGTWKLLLCLGRF